MNTVGTVSSEGIPSAATAQPPSQGAGVRLVSTCLCISSSLGVLCEALLALDKSDGIVLGSVWSRVASVCVLPSTLGGRAPVSTLQRRILRLKEGEGQHLTQIWPKLGS